jgi:glutamate-5-semialdehyde dehydrogenase
VNGVEEFVSSHEEITVVRDSVGVVESQITNAPLSSLGKEFEWEENPEFALVLVDSVADAVDLFNTYSPQFVISCVSESAEEIEFVWQKANAPFVGDGFTRWVDGQFALLRPELGLSNWESGRLFARSGILSGDSAFTVRLRVSQTNKDLHR